MNHRFEACILGAVAVGALTLAGCSSSGGGGAADTGGGGGGGGGTGDPSALTVLGARTLSDTQIELTFSAAVQVPDSDKAASLIALHGNVHNYGLTDSPTEGMNVVARFYSLTPDKASIYIAAFDSFASGDALTISQASAADDKVTLTLSSAIPPDADGGTGLLRLTYTGDADGIQDADGNYITDIALADAEDTGNLFDTVPADEGPKLVRAKTIDASTVELTFNEPIQIAIQPYVLASFAIVNNGFRRGGSDSTVGFHFYWWYDLDPAGTSAARGLFACRTSFAVSDGSIQVWCPTSSETFISYGLVSLQDATLPTESPNVLRLTLNGEIPAYADHDTGRLRLYYTPQWEGVTDGAGHAMPAIYPGTGHPGNVEDTVQ